MKLFLFMTFISYSIATNANEIDKIKTEKDVTLFLKKNFKYKDFNVSDTSWVHSGDIQLIELADSLKTNYWFIKDLDGNNETDLFAYGYGEYRNKDNGLELIVIFSKNGKYSKLDITKYYGRPFEKPELFPSLATVQNIPVLIITTKGYSNKFISSKRSVNSNQQLLNADTLSFQKGYPTLFSLSNFHPKIDQIEFSTTGCYGTCPIFQMKITSDRKIKYTAIKYNKEEGLFTCTLTNEDYDYLIKLLWALNFATLDDKYEVNWTDDQTAVSKIYYNSNKVKEISDYGKKSTLGMILFYQKLFELRSDVKNCH